MWDKTCKRGECFSVTWKNEKLYFKNKNGEMKSFNGAKIKNPREVEVIHQGSHKKISFKKAKVK